MTKRLGLAVCGLLVPVCVHAASSTTWEINGVSELLKGRMSGLSLTVNGNLSLGPSVEHEIASSQSAVWSLAAGPDGSVYVATGHQGKLLRVDANGKLSEAWTSPEPEVFAVATDGHGAVYAATSPNGALYRVENGKGTLVWRPGTKYIWSLALGLDGSVYLGTGDAGKIFRVRKDGKAELFYDTGQMNVTSLAIAADGALLAGTDPNG